ncbi:MAG: YceD family protein [Woeseiaceae bacterium]
MQTFAWLAEVLAADLSSLAEDEAPQKWRQSPVAIRLAFAWADSGRRLPAVEGRATARVPAVCQRCLGAFELALDVELKLLLAGPDDVVHATGDYEVWEIDEATIRPLDILEEALIMAMPLSALHGPGEDCVASAEAAPAAGDGTQRPFADLRSKISRSDDGEEPGNPE